MPSRHILGQNMTTLGPSDSQIRFWSIGLYLPPPLDCIITLRRPIIFSDRKTKNLKLGIGSRKNQPIKTQIYPALEKIILLILAKKDCWTGFYHTPILYFEVLAYISNFSIEGPQWEERTKKKCVNIGFYFLTKEKRNFPRLAKAFSIRVAERNRNLYIFLSREVPSAATPPRALQ